MLVSGRAAQLVFLIVICFFAVLFINRAKKGRVPWVRRVPGLDAIETAIKRATEMGRPVHFSVGFGHYGLTNPTVAPQMLAGLSVLSYIARIAANTKTELIVSLAHPEMIPLHEDILRQAYAAEGVPDKFTPDSVRFLSSYQFAYAAGVMGLLLKEKVASSIMIGSFWAEALLFAETGAAAGIVQIAGTAMVSQLPFFVATCDYVLIGEDIYTAGAYVSKEPVLLGSIQGQDVGKMFAIAVIIISIVLATFKIDLLDRLLKM